MQLGEEWKLTDRYFRFDINGLRAIAVVAVVLFHFNSSWLPGGFAGVDIFFVISGYLMTKIIFTGAESGSLSIIKFYKARANRILPALGVLSFALVVYGWFFLLNKEYQTLSLHLKSSLLFYSNHTYWMEAGYFDADSLEKWVLHTWSLSAEWQFYVLYPIAVYWFAKVLPLKQVARLILVATALSFCLCVYASTQWADAAYFLLPTRAWQMLLGAAVFLYPLQIKHKRIASSIGLALMLLSFVLFSEESAWPYYYALLPALACCLLLHASDQSNLVLSNVFSQKIGLWSYSIYLWHWPVVVFIHNLPNNNSSSVLYTVFGILCSIALGAASYCVVENRKLLSWKYGVYLLALAGSIYVFDYQGVYSDHRSMAQLEENRFISRYHDYWRHRADQFNSETQRQKVSCMVTSFERKNGYLGVAEGCVDLASSGGVFLWGDSHMEALSASLESTLPEKTVVNKVFSSGCPSSFEIKQGNVSRFRRACDYANAHARDAIEKIRPTIVIVANKDKHELMDWEETAQTLAGFGVEQFILLSPFPQWYPSLPSVYVKFDYGKETVSDQKLDKGVVRTNERMLERSRSQQAFHYINILDHVCPVQGAHRECRVLYNGELLAYDYGHLTVEGSRYVAEHIVFPALTDLH